MRLRLVGSSSLSIACDGVFANVVLDRPFTDLYDTEGNGGFPGIWFMARPVVGGHFAFLALERACGGKAVEALKFLDKREPGEVDVELVLMRDLSTGEQYDDEGWEDL